MQRLKIGAKAVVVLVIFYAVLSSTIFYMKKSAMDQPLDIIDSGQQVQNVRIQKVVDEGLASCTHADEEAVLRDQDVVQDDVIDQVVVRDELPQSADYYSFVTRPAQDCIIDKELLYTFDMLIGHNLEDFVRLVLQSNNNIVSKQACRSCAMYAFFNKIKKHQRLTVEDIATLQPLVANLYRFVQKMTAMSGGKLTLLRLEQYEALQDLHKSQKELNNKKLKARKAATAAALQRLQKISYR
jgi:hypothetical protein